MPLSNGNWEKYSTNHCTNARERASAADHVMYDQFREAYVIGVDEWDETTHDSIDVYDRWLPLAKHNANSRSSNQWQDIRRRSTTLMVLTKYQAEIWTSWHVWCLMSLEVHLSRNWGPRLGSRWNGSIEFWNSGPEENNQTGIPFFCFFLFSSLLHTSLLLWMLA